MQRLLRPVLNFAVEKFFPNGAFYGGQYLDSFKRADQKHDTGITGFAAAHYLTSVARESDAGEIKVTLEGCTVSGQPAGDWEVAVKRIQ